MRYIAPVAKCDVLEFEKYCECRYVVESYMKIHPLFQRVVRVVVMVTDRCA